MYNPCANARQKVVSENDEAAHCLHTVDDVTFERELGLELVARAHGEKELGLEEEGLEVGRLKVDLVKLDRDAIVFAAQEALLVSTDRNRFEFC